MRRIYNFLKYSFLFGIGAVLALRDGEKAVNELNNIIDGLPKPSFMGKDEWLVY